MIFWFVETLIIGFLLFVCFMHLQFRTGFLNNRSISAFGFELRITGKKKEFIKYELLQHIEDDPK